MSISVLAFATFAICITRAKVSNHLCLTPFIENANISTARDRSSVHPGLLLGIRSHSGFITVNKEYNSNLFFWYFPHEDPTVPWIIWLNGGPGVSSLLGLFDLIGPLKIENGTVAKRNVTWASDYSLLFIDSPVGAGFSFTEDDRGYTSSVDQVSEQLFEFLRQFLEVFPELRRAPLFVAGESYAGKYVPALAARIHKRRDSQPVNLRGIILGNAMIDPRNMMHYTSVMKALGFLDGDQLEKLTSLENATVRLIDEGNIVDASNKFNETIEYIKKETAVSIYNFLDPPTPITSDIEHFVDQDGVRVAIHVGNASFNLNNQLVYSKMLPDIANSSRPFVEELLKSYGVLCYSGQLDLILPYSNSKHVYAELQWPRRQEYVSAPRTLIKHEPGHVVAYRKAGGNFEDVLVRSCSHMAAKEKPEVMLNIARDFINKYKNATHS